MGAPQIDYITDVFAPFINSYFQQYDYDMNKIPSVAAEPPPLDIQIIKRGYYPKGGGIVHVNLRPPSSLLISSKKPGRTTFPPIRLTKCRPIGSISIKVFHAGKCPAWVAEKMASGAMKELKRAWRDDPRFRNRFSNVGATNDNDNENNGSSVDDDECGTARGKTTSPIIDGATVRITHEVNCLGSGSGILIVAHPENSNDNDDDDDGHPTKTPTSLPHHPPLASSGLGDRKVPPLQTGGNAAKELVECIASGGCVDRWLQDQLIPFMALADNGGSSAQQRSEVLVGELTLHSQTAMHVAERMTGCKFDVERVMVDRGVGVGGGDTAAAAAAGDEKQDGDDDNAYGETGRIVGGHIIRCRGIGFSYA